MQNKLIASKVTQLCVLFMFSACVSVQGGEWSLHQNRDGKWTTEQERNKDGPLKNSLDTGVYKGKIEPGDSRRLIDFLIKNDGRIDKIFLESPGGDVQEAIRVGEVINKARLDVYVQMNQTCASACFFVWLNGANRAVIFVGRPNGGRVGLHRPYLVDIGNTPDSISSQSKIMQNLVRYLESKLISRRLVDMMISRPSNDIYWLRDEDVTELGQSPPELEELYIAKCGDNRRQLYRQMTIAKSNSNQKLYDVLLHNVGKVNDCIDDLNSATRNNFLASARISSMRTK